MASTRATCIANVAPQFSAATHFNLKSKPQKVQQPIHHRPIGGVFTLNHTKRCTTIIAMASESPLSSLAETAALDELIDKLLSAKNANDLTQQVAENLLSFDQRFWLRLATRSDTASSDEDKEKLATLAKVVMQLVDAMVKATAEQLSDSSDILQEILRAAADEATGEWQIPLPSDKVDAIRKTMDKHADRLDEALLSNCYAWMRKASEDNLDGMISLLQKVLQVYAGRQLSQTKSDDEGVAGQFIVELLNDDEARWMRLIQERVQKGDVSEPAFMEALQRRMEGVVLGLASGSYAQRVQAEYLKELETRAKEVFDAAAGKK